MRRLPRILLNVATVVSVVLCVATLTLSMTGFGLYDSWIIYPPEHGAGLALTAGLFASTAFLAHFFARRCREQPGLCPACGYDLRATPDRCPECGTPPPPAAAAPAARP